MNITENEIPKHRKKKKSSTSSSSLKTKHKHNYTGCLLIENESPHKGQYCTICGKLNDVKFFEVNQDGVVMEDHEIFVKYKELPIMQIDNIFQKYIPVTQPLKTVADKDKVMNNNKN